MQHLRRHYFENCPGKGISDHYVALLDQGVDGSGNPRYAIKVGAMSTPEELAVILPFLLASPCFFKLPVGASAIVDIYVPDIFGSKEPKTFDYQVFKTKLGTEFTPTRAQALAEFRDRLLKDASSIFTIGPGFSEVPKEQSRGGDPPPDSQCFIDIETGGPCDGQTVCPCEDPITTVAQCVDGQLECIPLSSSLRMRPDK